MMTTKRVQFVEVDVRRTNGQVETVRMENMQLTPALFAGLKANTKKMGRGDALTFRNREEHIEVPMTLRQQRDYLAALHSAALDSYERGCAAGMASSKGWGDQAAVDTAAGDLAAFDGAHPEIVAAINAERAARFA